MIRIYRANAFPIGCWFAFLFCGHSAISQSNIEALDKYVTALSQSQEFNGTLLLAEKGKIVYQNSFGYADFSKAIKNTSTSLLNIASVSKAFTAIAILQLRDRKKLSLDDPFIKYFPEFPYPEITIKQLLSHTSGLPDNEALFDSLVQRHPSKVFFNVDIIPALRIYRYSKALRFKPGERWGYSNIGYDLLAMLVEQVSNMPFDIFMKKNIFLPAGMKSTYVQTSLAQKEDKKRCKNYTYNNHYEMRLQNMDSLADWKEFTYNLTGLIGSTNVISNAVDLWAYDKALSEGKLLNATTMQEAFTPVRLNNGDNNKAVQGSYGLGWFVATDSIGNTTVSHSGSAPGVLTYFTRNLYQKQTLIILQNVQNPMFNISPLLDILRGHPVTFYQSVAFAYGRDLVSKGPEYAMAQLQRNRTDTLRYALTERDMSRLGLEFSRNKNYQLYSLQAYKLNTEFFPESSRAFDDYAGALVKNGEKERAVMMYRKSLELNPANQNAKAALEKLLVSTPDR